MTWSHHTLNSQTLAELGCTSCVLTLTNQAQDQLSVTLPKTLASGSLQFLPFADYTLSRPTGSPVFRGWMLKPSRQIAAQESVQYTFDGPWQAVLNREVYEQNWMLYDADAVELAQAPITRIILNQKLDEEGELTRISIKEQIEDALAQQSLGYTTGAIPELMPPWSDLTDRTIGEVITNQLRWVPQISAKWDYSGTTTLIFVDSTGSTLHTFNASSAPSGYAIEISPLVPRYDLFVPLFRVRWVQQMEGGFRAIIGEHESTASFPGGFGAMQQTIEMAQDEPAPSEEERQALCEAAHRAYAHIFHSATITLTGQDCYYDVAVGDRVQWTNAGENGSGIAQQISHDILAGKTSIQTGPPTQLGLSDLIALIDHQRQRRKPDGSRGSGKAFEPEDGDFAPWTLVPCDEDGKEQKLGSADATHVRLVAGGANDYSAVDLGFQAGDNPPEVLSVSDGERVWVVASRGTGTEVSEVSWDHGSSMPSNSNSQAVQEIGHVDFSSGIVQSVHQEISGHLSVSFCRDWFVTPASYTGQWSAS